MNPISTNNNVFELFISKILYLFLYFFQKFHSFFWIYKTTGIFIIVAN